MFRLRFATLNTNGLPGMFPYLACCALHEGIETVAQPPSLLALNLARASGKGSVANVAAPAIQQGVRLCAQSMWTRLRPACGVGRNGNTV